ncbi:hypothetical protein [Leifsonia sp. NPDC077715]|uniref:hypothetical protein n=1 Tax=Leifsonia sp. NPDC077715 TaxID=3155539 RepID=UPI00341A5E92
MTNSLDQFYEYLENWGEPIQRIDRVSNTVYVKALDGRVVSLRVSVASVSRMASRTDLDWMGGTSDAERGFGLFMVHLDETINSSGNQDYLRFALNDDGGPEPAE